MDYAGDVMGELVAGELVVCAGNLQPFAGLPTSGKDLEMGSVFLRWKFMVVVR